MALPSAEPADCSMILLVPVRSRLIAGALPSPIRPMHYFLPALTDPSLLEQSNCYRHQRLVAVEVIARAYRGVLGHSSQSRLLLAERESESESECVCVSSLSAREPLAGSISHASHAQRYWRQLTTATTTTQSRTGCV